MVETPRNRLNRRLVLSGAVAYADREGLEALSMRALATELDRVPMALYKHVTDKEDLLDGMVDTVVATYPVPPEGLEWSAAVRYRILGARRLLLTHPWLRPAIETRSRRSLTVLDYLDAVAGDFMGGGLSADLTHHAMHALGHRVWGFSPEAFEAPTGEPVVAPTPAETAALQARLPHIAAIVAEADRRSGGCDEQDEFEFTLDLLLDAFRRLHVAGWSSGAGSR